MYYFCLSSREGRMKTWCTWHLLFGGGKTDHRFIQNHTRKTGCGFSRVGGWFGPTRSYGVACKYSAWPKIGSGKIFEGFFNLFGGGSPSFGGGGAPFGGCLIGYSKRGWVFVFFFSATSPVPKTASFLVLHSSPALHRVSLPRNAGIGWHSNRGLPARVCREKRSSWLHGRNLSMYFYTTLALRKSCFCLSHLS